MLCLLLTIAAHYKVTLLNDYDEEVWKSANSNNNNGHNATTKHNMNN